MGMVFDIRYKRIIDLLDYKGKDGVSILEVGALPPACLSWHIGDEVKYLGIDKNLEDEKYRIKKIDFLNNEFSDCEFTHTLSTDTLEHVEKQDRKKFIEELLRVTNNKVIIGVPNPEAREYEKTLINLLEGTDKGKSYVRFFNEHEEYGIPERAEIEGYLKGYKYTVISSLSLKYWVALLMLDINKIPVDITGIKDFDDEPTYRSFYVVDCKA